MIKSINLKPLKALKPRNLLLLMAVSFFLPWMSIGYIQKSAFDFILYAKEVNDMISFFMQEPSPVTPYLWIRFLFLIIPIGIGIMLYFENKGLQLLISIMMLLFSLLIWILLSLPIPSFTGYGLGIFILLDILYIVLILSKRSETV